jgi:hypothetical protein
MHGVYAYAWHNPLAYADPTGTEPRPIHNRNNKNPKASDFKGDQTAQRRYQHGRTSVSYVSHTTAITRETSRASNRAATTHSQATQARAQRTEPKRDAAASSRAPRPQRVSNEVAGGGQALWEAGPGFLGWYGKYGNIYGWLGLNNRAYDQVIGYERGLQALGGADASSSGYKGTYWGGSIAMVFIPGPGSGEANLLRAGTRAAAKPVPNPSSVRRPNGAPDRSSPWYVSYRDADGNLQTVGNLDGVHAEVRIQQMQPGASMSRPFGWRTRDSAIGPEWVEGTVCASCQVFPRGLFAPGTRGAPGGPWGD